MTAPARPTPLRFGLAGIVFAAAEVHPAGMLSLVIGWLALVTVAPAPHGAQQWPLFPRMIGSGATSLVAEESSVRQGTNQPAPHGKDKGVVVAPGAPQAIDVNRPQSQFDCELPIGQEWYGSRERCLAYMCGGKNVYNEYVFDADGRRRKNPCYGQSPTEFPPE
jgi:hypothetical protein